IQALALGAVDFVAKPSGPVSLDLDRVAQELRQKVRLAAGVPVRTLRPPTTRRGTGSKQGVARSAATGGIRSASGLRVPAAPQSKPSIGARGNARLATGQDPRRPHPPARPSGGWSGAEEPLRRPRGTLAAPMTHLVLIAASTGGPGVLYRMLERLPGDLAAALVI